MTLFPNTNISLCVPFVVAPETIKIRGIIEKSETNRIGLIFVYGFPWLKQVEE